MAVDTSRLRFGDLVAGGSAVALFIFMLFPWYKVSVKGLGVGQSEGGNAWETLGPGDLFLLLLILIVIGCVAVRALGAEANIPVPVSTVMLAAGGLATLYILWRIISLPGELGDAKDQLNALGRVGGVSVDIGRSFGIFLGFLAAIGIAVGSFLSARERGEAVPGLDGAGGYGGARGDGPLGGGPATTTAPAATAGVGAASAGAASAAAADPGAGTGGPKADWYPDPQGQARLRYWDGTQWTDQTAD